MNTKTKANYEQLKQLNRLAAESFAEVLKEMNLTQEDIERLSCRKDDFKEIIRGSILTSLQQMTVVDAYQEEEVRSESGYAVTFKSLTDQADILRTLFPGSGNLNHEIQGIDMPDDMEHWFAIPKWQTLAPTYGKAVQLVFEKLKKLHGSSFINRKDGNSFDVFLRQSAKKVHALQELCKQQENWNTLVVPAQLGMKHRGRSVRRSRAFFFTKEFGLGAFEVGIILLTHPERFKDKKELWIDCPGDECQQGDTVNFSRAPVFFPYETNIEFDTYWQGRAVAHSGSASASLL